MCSIIGTRVRALGALAGSERAISRMLIDGLLMSMPSPPPVPGGGRRVRSVRTMFPKRPWRWKSSLYIPWERAQEREPSRERMPT